MFFVKKYRSRLYIEFQKSLNKLPINAKAADQLC